MKIAILGASRGLGAAFASHIQKIHSETCLLLAARSKDKLFSLKREKDLVFTADFTNPSDQKELTHYLSEFDADEIFYVAGGGPFGPFEKKEWKDHLWALEVNMLFPAKLLHEIMVHKDQYQALKKTVFVGSAIAGRTPDPNASSYAASKHGLRGLILSIKAENPSLDIRLFEPGYMDTNMLPPNAWPRQQGIIKSVQIEAQKLWQWSRT